MRYTENLLPRIDRNRALIMTSFLTGVFIFMLYRVTIRNQQPVAEKTELIELDLAAQPLMENTAPAQGNQPDRTPQKQIAAPAEQQHQNKQQENTIRQDALLPDLSYTDNGNGKDNTNQPGTDEPVDGGSPHTGEHNPNTGTMYSLGGRDCIFKPVMNDEVSEQGCVAISIWVNEQGLVTRAAVKEQNTNTNNPLLRKLALRSALKTKWTEKKGIPEQKGQIMYKFVLK